MRHGSLFSGIGGFDLAAEWAGWTNIFQVEWNPFCQKILKKNFPNANIFGDIKEFDGSAWRGAVDVISGGFPCQPYSSAGKRLGKNDERHLWPEMLRVIRQVGPRWVVGENVFGLVNWSGGLVFEEVQFDLEAAGYEVQAFILPAASTGAPHQRQRVWFIAHANNVIGERQQPEQLQNTEEKQPFVAEGFAGGIASDANIRRLEKRLCKSIQRSKKVNDANKRNIFLQWQNFPTQPPVCGRNDGIPRRMDRIAALGNAVVPQLVWRIFDTINQYEQWQKTP